MPHVPCVERTLMPLDRTSVAEVQQMLAQKVLDHVGGLRVKTAKILGIFRPRLNRILKNPRDRSEE
jgi:DNA-binding protein Fis